MWWVLSVGSQQLRFAWKQTGLGLLSVTVGVFVLLVVLSFARGVEDFYVDRLLRLTPHITLEAGINEEVTEDLGSRIGEVAGVAGWAPYLTLPGLVQRHLAALPVTIKGVDWDAENELYGLSGLLDVGDWQDVPGASGVLLGGELARQLSVGVDDLIQLTSVGGSLYLPVLGLFFTGFYPNDAGLALVPLQAAQRLGDRSGLTGYAVNLTDQEAIARHILPLQEATDLWVRPWYVRNQSLFAGLRVQRAVMVWLTFFVFVAAAFGMANLFVLKMIGQTRTIGVLRAMGATPGQVGWLFVLQAVLCGVGGVVVGSIAAWATVHILQGYPVRLPEVYYVEYLPMRWAGNDWWWVSLVAVTTSAIAAAVPAWRLSRFDPAEVVVHD